LFGVITHTHRGRQSTSATEGNISMHKLHCLTTIWVT